MKWYLSGVATAWDLGVWDFPSQPALFIPHCPSSLPPLLSHGDLGELSCCFSCSSFPAAPWGMKTRRTAGGCCFFPLFGGHMAGLSRSSCTPLFLKGFPTRPTPAAPRQEMSALCSPLLDLKCELPARENSVWIPPGCKAVVVLLFLGTICPSPPLLS